jgi:hypothetical protein
LELKINEAIACIGKAGYGKTYWINHHIELLPPDQLYIFDYNRYDYAQHLNTGAHVWLVESGTPEEAQQFMDMCYAKENPSTNKPEDGWTFIVLEEADNYLTKNLAGIARFVNTARNRDIGFIISCKRPKAVPPRYRTRFNKLIVFHMDLIDDIEYTEEWIGCKKSHCLTTNGRDVRSLDVGEFYLVDLDKSTISEKMKL